MQTTMRWRRPKFAVEELSTADLAKRFGAVAGLFFLFTIGWILVAEDYYREPRYLKLHYCNAEGDEAQAATLQDSLEIISTIGRAVCGELPAGQELDADLDRGPVRLRMELTAQSGSLMHASMDVRQIQVGSSDPVFTTLETLYDRTDRIKANPPGLTTSMSCRQNGTEDSVTRCDLAADIAARWDVKTQLRPAVTWTKAPPLLFKAMESMRLYVLTVNASFVWQELLVRYLFMVTAGVLGGVLFYKVSLQLQYPWAAWAQEQKWTLILLVALVGFNNPFAALRYSAEGSELWTAVDNVLTATFICCYLLSVLSVIDHMAQMKKKPTLQFYIPKILLFLPAWCCLVKTSSRSWVLLEMQHVANDTAVVVVLTVTLVVYVLWVVYLLALMYVKESTSKTAAAEVGFRFKMLGALNLVMVFGFGASLYRVHLWGLLGAESVYATVLMNVYVIFLFLMYVPADSATKYHPPAAAPVVDGDPTGGEVNEEYEMAGDY